MNKRIIVILILVLCLAMALILFTVAHAKTNNKTNKANETKEPTERMVIVESLGNYCIIYDKYTKVMYSVSDSAYNRGAVTLLVDADGKPLLYTEEGENK